MQTTKAMSSWQFTLFRVCLGLYLLCHFLHLLPWGAELFANTGLLSDGSLNPTSGLFVSPLTFWDTPAMVTIMLGLAVLASALFTLGWQRAWMAGLLWFLWTAFFHRNNLISNPSLPYVGLLLLLTTLVPLGEPLAWRKERLDAWEMPIWIWRAAAWLLAAGYTFSGWTKLSSPSWLDGTALAHVLNNPLARPGLAREFLLALPENLLLIATWGALLAELLYLPLMAFRKARPWVWLGLVLMHLGIILVVDFADLSLGMLLIHLFVFDPEWLPAKKGKSSNVFVAFDGDCLMCNRFVTFLAEEDRADYLRFAPLGESTPDTIRVTRGDKVFERSTAILVIGEALGGHWRALAMLGRIIPKGIRDLAYRIIARHRHKFFKRPQACGLPSAKLQHRLTGATLRISMIAAAGLVLTPPVTEAAWFPFTLMERPPGGKALQNPDKAAFQVLGSFSPDHPDTFATWKSALQPGDLLAFRMPRKQRWRHLRKGEIKKVPYELFRYGHLAMVVEPPTGEQDLRLLQLAMAQAVSSHDTLTYATDKWWIAFRPSGKVDRQRLREFVSIALERGSSRKKAYHYTGALGLYNVDIEPDHPEDIGKQFTCTTLLLAAYHYAGFPIDGLNRGGFLDVVTPAQVVHSKRIIAESVPASRKETKRRALGRRRRR